MIIIAGLSTALAIHAMVTGETKVGKSGSVSRKKDPGGFWQLIAFKLGVSGVLLFYASRGPTSQIAASAAGKTSTLPKEKAKKG